MRKNKVNIRAKMQVNYTISLGGEDIVISVGL